MSIKAGIPTGLHFRGGVLTYNTFKIGGVQIWQEEFVELQRHCSRRSSCLKNRIAGEKQMVSNTMEITNCIQFGSQQYIKWFTYLKRLCSLAMQATYHKKMVIHVLQLNLLNATTIKYLTHCLKRERQQSLMYTYTNSRLIAETLFQNE